MARILSLIHSLSRGGAARAMMGVAKHSTKLFGHEHRLIGLMPGDKLAYDLAREAGMIVNESTERSEVLREIAEADVVVYNWWNQPDTNNFLRSKLPPSRFVSWMHVAGDAAPQIVPDELVRYVDCAVACSPHTYDCSAIQSLPPTERKTRAGMAYGAADFDRVRGITPKPHTGFNVGYIGTVHYLKMHPKFVEMSANIKVPDIKIIVCGDGDGGRAAAEAAKSADPGRFDFRGYVDNIREVIPLFDAYGYPLCENTYAAAEVNLQEVMYCGVPVVVFPYGGVRHLVVNNYTGLIVHSEHEYAQAIEYLYHNPAERIRLGANAQNYAEQIFGAENAAREFEGIFSRLLDQPKRSRIWGKDSAQPVLSQPLMLNDLVEQELSGVEAFFRDLRDETLEKTFRATMIDSSETALFDADEQVAQLSELIIANGVRPWRRAYPQDGFLAFWSGLGLMAERDLDGATVELVEALKLGCNHWRVGWYLAQCAARNHVELAKNILRDIVKGVPNFAPARDLQRRLEEEVCHDRA